MKPPVHQINDGYLRTEDAARYVNFSKSKLEKLRLYGGGPRYYKHGKIVIYRKPDLDAWIAAQARTSTSDPVPAARHGW